MVGPGFLGESDVPLEEDVLKRPVEFIKNWKEFQSTRGEQISRSVINFVGAGDSDFFTVPKGKTFFLTNAWLSVDGVTSGDDTHTLSVETQFTLLGISNTGAAAARVSGSLAMSYPMPLKVNEEEFFRLALGTATGSAGIIGFLEPKEISG